MPASEQHSDLVSPSRGILHSGLPPLRFSLPLLLLAFGLGLILFQFLYLTKVDEERARRNVSNQCKHTGQRMALSLGRMLKERRVDAIRSDLKRLLNIPGVRESVVVDAQERVVVGERESWTGKSAEGLLPPHVLEVLRRSLKENHRLIEADQDGSGMVGVFPMSVHEPSVFILEMDLKEALLEARNSAVAHAIRSGTALLLACAGLWLVLDRVITRRVTKILVDARAISTGDLSDRALEGRDELAEIDRALRETHLIISRQAEGIRSQEMRYRLMVESLPAMVYVARDSVIEYINDTGLQMLGLNGREEIIGRSPFDFIHPRHHEAVKGRIREVLRSGASAPPAEEEVVRRDGTILEVETVASVFTDARGQATQVVMHDITERKAAEARREALGREITNTSEREQRRIGQDLHDDICQRLAAVKMNMQDLEESLADQAPALMDEADQIVDRLTDAIRITRSLARGLSPVEIEAGGLGVALAGLVRSSRELLEIECELELPDELPAMPPHVATQFYRIAQECITNAAKHGQAPVVRVAVAERDDNLVLRVSNNGHPMSPNADRSQGMGLHIMRHRAESMDARLEFELHPPDASFAVRCEMPLSRLNPHPTSTAS